MKRDMDVIREIVLALDSVDCVAPLNGILGLDQVVFAYQAQLLIEAGMVLGHAGGVQKGIPASAQLFRLTWSGHDFACSVKDDTLWNKAKLNVLKPAASWSFGVLLAYLKAEITRQIPGLD